MDENTPRPTDWTDPAPRSVHEITASFQIPTHLVAENYAAVYEGENPDNAWNKPDIEEEDKDDDNDDMFIIE